MSSSESLKTMQLRRNLEDFARCMSLGICWKDGMCLWNNLIPLSLRIFSAPEFSASVMEQLRLACENGLSYDEISHILRIAYAHPCDSTGLVELRESYEKLHQVKKLVSKGKKILDI